MESISEELHSAVIEEIKNNPEKYTGAEEENTMCALQQIYIDNPEIFQLNNPIDALMLQMIQMK